MKVPLHRGCDACQTKPICYFVFLQMRAFKAHLECQLLQVLSNALVALPPLIACRL